MPNEPKRSTAAVSSEGHRRHLDLRGLRCPLPVLHTKRALARLSAGSVLDVRCSDPLATLDIPNLLRETGDELLASLQRDGDLTFTIRKGARETRSVGTQGEDPSVAAGVDRTE